jgi:hypothetical protein
MRLKLEDKDGLPWTASTSLGWITLITVLTFGTALLFLASYLAIWIRSKGRSVLPLIGFLIVACATIVDVALNHFSIHMAALDYAGDLITLVWILSSFSLRHEIRRYFQESEGWDVRIGPVFTFLFSALYINYCLNPVTFPHKEPITSLDLRK